MSTISISPRPVTANSVLGGNKTKEELASIRHNMMKKKFKERSILKKKSF